jgi:hypothetical protein
MSIIPTESYCGRCKEIRANVHQCYDDPKPKPKAMLRFNIDEKGPVYRYNRRKYRLVPDPELSSEHEEAFRVVEK